MRFDYAIRTVLQTFILCTPSQPVHHLTTTAQHDQHHWDVDLRNIKCRELFVNVDYTCVLVRLHVEYEKVLTLFGFPLHHRHSFV